MKEDEGEEHRNEEFKQGIDEHSHLDEGAEGNREQHLPSEDSP